MWIEISDSLPEAFPELDLNYCSVLQAIADASFHGRHVLYGSSSTLSWLYRQDIGGPAKAAVNRVKANLSEKGALREGVKTKLIVGAVDGPIYKDEAGYWHAPIQRLVGVPMLQVEVLAENTRDVAALKYAALHYKKVKNLASLQVALMPHNGGGTEILNCFQEALMAREKFTCVVTDSDKDHPNAMPGNIGRSCAAKSIDSEWICMHFDLPFREMENILPLNIVQDSIFSEAHNADLFPPFNEIIEILKKRPDVLKYMDVKLGTTGSASSQLELNLERREFWAQVVADCDLKKKICDEVCDSHPCKCRISPGLGANVLQRFLDYCEMISIPKQVERMQTSVYAVDWLDVGGRIFDWAQADQPLRA